ncbi:MAG: SEL1-like repeat protein [gamma proteobacterium symbiont of Lucinoma myriamae]|nr:SEL1-like repeat protein [gamma proteobacterium symbiont of Lucinoma myriamae]MCU7818107.1 SEL1-like repeat protein [gamma proteobacterium symbiont of Lucinoma myriamae]MCU7832509.1 SEL1-like repeat protein [gamma proteobacterium symbiont of Lucinoma myriamae]
MLISLNNFSSIYYIKIQFLIRRLIHISCLILFISPLLSFAGENEKYNQGAFYFSKGDYITALNIWTPLAKQANPAAQYSIGLLYDQGKGVIKDPKQALKYLQLAAKQGLPAAQYYLGVKYSAGLDVTKDPHKARQLLIQAAQQDHLQAQFHVATLYARGEGGPQDQHQATYWFNKASENGYGPAQHSLASRYLTGKGTDLDLDRGIFWLKKAADQHDTDALRDLGFMYFQGMGVDKNYQQARDLLLLPAEDGSGLALFLLGEIYAQGGYGINKDVRQAKKWYRQAQKLGYTQVTGQLQKLSGKNPQSPAVNNAKTTQPEVKTIAQSSAGKPNLENSRIDNLSIEESSNRFNKINDNYYSLQLLSARQYSSITHLTDRFADKHTYVLKIQKDKVTSFILTYGAYADYEDAKAAITTLPSILQLKSKPWIRQVKSIKSLIIVK